MAVFRQLLPVAVLALAALTSEPVFGADVASNHATQAGEKEPYAVSSALNFTMRNIDGKDVPLASYRGRVILVVNVASRCGNTPQYKQLEALHRAYASKGLAILGFPANNFGRQEPGSDAQIKEFCTTTYDVTFDMFSKISVKGEDQHPLYKFLTSKETNPSCPGPVTWNFEKFLIDRQGKVIARFSPRTKPDAEQVVKAIEAELAKPAPTAQPHPQQSIHR